MKRYLFSLLTFLFLICINATSVSATAKFLVLCTTACTWDNTNDAIWSTSSGGVNNTTHPVAADTVTLDANSCVGGLTCTITVNANLSIASIAMGACTASTTGCVLDFSANNNSLTTGTFSGTGTGTRTLNCGTNTFHITGAGSSWDFTTNTNLTFTCGSFTLSFEASTGSASSITFGTPTGNYGSLKFGPNSNSPSYNLLSTTAVTFNGTLQATAPANIQIGLAANLTFTGGFALAGTSTNPIYISTNTSGNGTSTLTAGAASTCSWCIFKAVVGATNTITATNSFNLSSAVGVGTLTITPPTAGTGGGIIGG